MRFWKTGMLLALCLFVILSCGPSGGMIETPAKDMNLTEAEVGSGYSVSEDQGLEALKADWDLPDDKELKDASFRMFESEAGIVLAVVVTMNKEATSDDLEGLTEGFETGFSGELPGVELKQGSAPSVGDEAVLTSAELAEFGIGMYFIGFRKVNVVGIVALVGMGGTATEDQAVALAQKMAGKIK